MKVDPNTVGSTPSSPVVDLLTRPSADSGCHRGLPATPWRRSSRKGAPRGSCASRTGPAGDPPSIENATTATSHPASGSGFRRTTILTGAILATLAAPLPGRSVIQGVTATATSWWTMPDPTNPYQSPVNLVNSGGLSAPDVKLRVNTIHDPANPHARLSEVMFTAVDKFTPLQIKGIKVEQGGGTLWMNRAVSIKHCVS